MLGSTIPSHSVAPSHCQRASPGSKSITIRLAPSTIGSGRLVTRIRTLVRPEAGLLTQPLARTGPRAAPRLRAARPPGTAKLRPEWMRGRQQQPPTPFQTAEPACLADASIAEARQGVGRECSKLRDKSAASRHVTVMPGAVRRSTSRAPRPDTRWLRPIRMRHCFPRRAQSMHSRATV